MKKTLWLVLILSLFIGVNVNAAPKAPPYIVSSSDCTWLTFYGVLCHDTDDGKLYKWGGASLVELASAAGAGDISDVWNCATGDCADLTAGAADSLNATSASYIIPFVILADCSGVTAEGRACWDSNDDILYVGDGAAAKAVGTGTGDVSGVGDCASGACYDGSSDGGTYVRLYDGNSHYTAIVAGDSSANLTFTLPTAASGGNNYLLNFDADGTGGFTDPATFQPADAELTTIAALTETRGDLMYVNSSAEWADLAIGAANTVLTTNGTDPAWATVTSAMITDATIAAADIANNTITATQLAATLTFSDGDILDLGGITHSGAADEGLVLPTWANQVPGSDKKFLAADGSSLKLYNGGWVTIGATAAPTDATYLTLSNDATLSTERVLTAGTNGIDFVDAGANSTLTINFDPTEVGTSTWGSGSAVVWTFDASGGTDPTITFGDNLVTVGHPLTVTGVLTANGGIVMGTGDGFTVNSVNLLSGDELDGTKIKDADYGDVTINAAGVWSVEDDSHAHGSTTITLASTNLSDTTNVARLDASNTFTGATNTVGNGNADLLAVQASIKGVGRAVTIDDDGTASPSYATATQSLYVAGDIETAGTVYAAAFNGGTGTDGSRALTMTSNTGANVPTASGNKLYFIDNVLKVVEDGTAKDVPLPGDSVTWTGATHSFAGVTNFVLPTAAPDAAGEIAINTTSHQLQLHTGAALNTIDFDSCGSGQVLKSDGSGAWTCGDDSTGGSPTLDTVGDPSGDSEIVFQAGEEIKWTFSGNYTTGSQFLISQETGNPSGGVLFEVIAADTDTTVAKFGDGTDYVQISKIGAVSFGGTNATFSAAATATSIPMKVGTATASGVTAAGAMYFESDTEILTIGDGATSISLDMAPNVVYTFPAATSTLARTDAGQTFTGVQAFTAPTVATSIAPASADGATLGTAAAEFSDLYLADGGVIYFQNDQSVYLTPSAGTLTLTGSLASTGSVTVGTTLLPDANDGATIGSTSAGWSDMHLASGGVINWFNGAFTMSHDWATTSLILNGSIVLDDGSGASPSFTFQDETNETATFNKTDSGYLTLTTVAADGLQILTGNLKVGNGAPTQTLNGEDAYIEGLLEVDGVLYADGGITSGGAVALGANHLTTTTGQIQVGDSATYLYQPADGYVGLIGDTGVRFTAGDEDLQLTKTGTDGITIGSGSGTTTITTALNLVSTGTIQGGVTISSDADGMAAADMTTAGVRGTMFIATGNGTWILPRAVLGDSLCLMDSGTAHDLILDVTAGSTIRLKGTEQADGVGITNAAGTSTGDFVCVIAVATDKWSTVGIGGTWASQ